MTAAWAVPLCSRPVLASIADRASIRSFSVGDWAGLNGLGGEAEELATRAYAPELLTLTLHGSGSAAFREGGQARYGFLSTLLRLPKELSLSGKRSLSNASCFQEARRKVTQLRHGVYAALLLAKANGRQLSEHRSRGRERPQAKRTIVFAIVVPTFPPQILNGASPRTALTIPF